MTTRRTCASVFVGPGVEGKEIGSAHPLTRFFNDITCENSSTSRKVSVDRFNQISDLPTSVVIFGPVDDNCDNEKMVEDEPLT